MRRNRKFPSVRHARFARTPHSHAPPPCPTPSSALSFSPSPPPGKCCGEVSTGGRMGLLEGKKGLILNIANDRSIAWHIANNAVKQGATCGFGYLDVGKMERRVRGAMEEGGFGSSWLHPCDVSKDEDVEKFFAGAREKFGTIDFLVHSLAFADKNYLEKGKFLSTPRDVFKQAVDISAYSLIALARG